MKNQRVFPQSIFASQLENRLGLDLATRILSADSLNLPLPSPLSSKATATLDIASSPPALTTTTSPETAASTGTTNVANGLRPFIIGEIVPMATHAVGNLVGSLLALQLDAQPKEQEVKVDAGQLNRSRLGGWR